MKTFAKESVLDRDLQVCSFDTVIVGSGAAGLNAAVSLYKFGRKNIAVVTEGLLLGTSRNTGSDKQTYYKMTLAGNQGDSVRGMANTLFSGGAVDGDIALAEAANSLACFFNLVDIGVPFPQNEYGEYVGYKTDHDPVTRGTSAGPLTSKYMVEALIRECRKFDIPIYDTFQVIKLLTGKETRRALGVIAIDHSRLNEKHIPYVVFFANNVIFATGGDAGLYKASVYPPQQTGSMGLLLKEGVAAKNLTESQFGIASVQFRWNLSGSYQQVLPRYVSTDQDGNDLRDFLPAYFSDYASMLQAIFLKGYQWPFDPRKIDKQGSSLIDVAVFYETSVLGRRVYLDYTHNPVYKEEEFSLDSLPPVVSDYLKKSGCTFPLPIERLEAMNPDAVKLYRDHHIDLHNELLEIAVCAQHCNGGIASDCWWQSSLPHLFAVGELNGSHGVSRPGGSALNAGQVGSRRAAQFISKACKEEEILTDRLLRECRSQIESVIRDEQDVFQRDPADLKAEWNKIQSRMSETAAIIRRKPHVEKALAESGEQMKFLQNSAGVRNHTQFLMLHRIRNLSVSQFVYLSMIDDYIRQGGASRGSYMIADEDGMSISDFLPEDFRYKLDDGNWNDRIQEAVLSEGKCTCTWRAVRPLPDPDTWFESVWRVFREGGIYHSVETVNDNN